MSENLTSLVIEDNPADARFLIELLAEDPTARFAAETVNTLQDALELLGRRSFDVILLDLSLPDSRGLDGLRKIQSLSPATPIIIMTGQGGQDTAVGALSLGAQDYLVKGEVDGQLLSRSIRYAIERKRVEEKLRQSEEQANALIRYAPVAIYEIDYRGPRFTRVNEAMAAMTGYSREELLAMSPFELLDDESQQRLRDRLQKAIAGVKPSEDVEFRVIRKDGKELYVILKVKFSVDQAGKPLKAFVIGHDITERKRSEEALRASEEKFSLIFNKGPLPTSLSSEADGIFLDVNEAFAEKFGYRRKEIIGRSSLDLGIVRDIEDRGKIIEGINEVGSVRGREVELYKRSGERVLVSLNLDAVEIAGKKYVLTVMEDITERRRAEKELKRRDQAIRRAYTDVIDAVTGGKLILMTSEEIREALGEPIAPASRVDSPAGISAARKTSESMLACCLPHPMIPQAVLILGEAINNAIVHAGSAEYQLYRRDEFVQMRISDKGPGIDFSHLPRATLVPGYSTTAGSLGMGFSIMLSQSDRVLLSTRRGETIIVLEVSANGDGRKIPG